MNRLFMHQRATIRAAAIGLAALAVLVLSGATNPQTVTPPPLVCITLHGASGQAAFVKAEVADTTEMMLRGLMFRSYLPPSSGMLFDFGDTVLIPFYMRNTYIPLSIAFISAEGEILDILDMEPLDEERRAPTHPYRYALEVNQGFFEMHHLKAGDRVYFTYRRSQ
ncbi:MAG: DUF192 domain-containing protein [Dehalococcoidia bacterium]|nr:DUF192 domain-containing protein [Dehalococcoidia bacterium]MDP7240619.1 DUF192 domain-containing protein [Dehalococcoidia bacterium]